MLRQSLFLRKICLIVLCTTLISAILFSSGVITQISYADEPYEPNETLQEAVEISLDSSFSSSIDTSGDDDWYKVQSPDARVIQVQLQVPNLKNYDIEVVNANGQLMNQSSNETAVQETFSFLAEANESYYLHIYGTTLNDFGLDPYYLSLSSEALGNYDSYEPNNEKTSAVEIQAGDDFYSYIQSSDDRDWYHFHTLQSQEVEVRLDVASSQDYELSIINESGQTVRSGKKGKGKPEKLTFTTVPNQKYYVVVEGAYSYSHGQQPYHLIVDTLTSQLNYDTAYAGATLGSMKAVQMGDSLYLSVSGTTMQTSFEFYIDSDFNSSTGTAVSNWSDSQGIDYKVSDNSLLKYENGNWIPVGGVTLVGNDTLIEVSVPLAAMGIGATQKIRVGFNKNDSETLPRSGVALFPVFDAAYSSFDPYSMINVDGNVSDWTLSPTAGDGQLSISGMIADGKLFLQADGNIGDWNDFYIDIDYNGNTGKNYSTWPSFGAEFLIENGGLYRVKADRVSWDWLLDLAEYEETATTLELAIPLDELGVTETSTIKVAFNTEDNEVSQTLTIHPTRPQVVIDGLINEWKYFSPLVSGEGSISNLFAIKQDHILNIMTKGNGLSDDQQIYIDSDNNAATGYQGSVMSQNGADYMVQNGILKSYIDGNWSVVSGTVQVSHLSSLAYEFSVDMNGWSNVSDVVRVSVSDGSSYAPASNPPFRMPAISDTLPFVIEIDGTSNDWNRVTQEAVGSLTQSSLSAYKDEDFLHLVVKGTNLNTENVFFLDSDHNAETGFSDQNWNESGIDYKIERNQLFRYETSNQSWINVGPVFASVYPERIEMKLYLDAINAESSDEIKVAYLGKGSLSIPNTGSNMLSVNVINLMGKNASTFYPRESFAVLDNPFRGFTGSARINQTSHQPMGLVTTNITWAELEPVKGEFDWNGVQTRRNFDYWTSKGKKINLRFIMDSPDDTAHKDIPDWLYDELVDAEGAEGAGVWYDDESLGFSPNYNSETLIEEHERVIQALAQKYDNDPRIGFIEIGSLGHFGEFHTVLIEDGFPKVSVSDQYVQHYVDYFHNKKLGMRKPFPLSAQHQMGLFNDVFAGNSTDSWLRWIDKGWSGLEDYNDTNIDSIQLQESSAMPEFWKTNYSGGEFSSGQPVRNYISNDQIMESLRQARESHTTYIGAASLVGYQLGTDITADQQANIDLLLNTLGYRFVLDSVSHSNNIAEGDALAITSSWRNIGVAPFYEQWPIAYALADPNGNLVASSIQNTSIDIRTWAPGSYNNSFSFEIPESIPGGQYTLLVGILDPDTGKPGVKLANEGARFDGWFALDQVAITNATPANPNAPGHLRTTSQTDRSLDLAWDQAYDDDEISGYEVYKNNVLAGFTEDASYLLNGLVQNTAYDISVSAVDIDGNKSVKTTERFTTSVSNLLPNGGFETYTGSSGAADGWNTDGSDWSVVTTPVVEDTRAQRLGLSGLGAGHYIELYRDVAVTAGKTFALDGQFNAASMNDAKVQMNIS
ncbi:DUF4832 domain-containing protein, partial [Cohnella silvisoli]